MNNQANTQYQETITIYTGNLNSKRPFTASILGGDYVRTERNPNSEFARDHFKGRPVRFESIGQAQRILSARFPNANIRVA